MSEEIKEKRYEIFDNHIGIFHNFFPEKLMESYIKHFEKSNEQNLTWTRPNPEDRKDKAIPTIMDFEEKYFPYNNNEFIKIFFNECYKLYVDKYDLLKELQRHTIYEMKVQKTKPSEGYHVWHTENMQKEVSNRIAVFGLFLNDVKEGGETEFLYQKLRVKPVKNTLIIWPANYTHFHRGNPPISNDKYLLTGWVEYGDRQFP
tara:strand:- start:237 stop:845 length:609 start_codon:yes stop_codon:yes gene_type:complete